MSEAAIADDQLIESIGRSDHLERLEAESIHIMREVAAELDNPVLLYSIGKDSSVLLHLALKAFYPGKPPFPFLHIDSTWEFREMIEFREQYVRDQLGLNVIAHVNEEGVAKGINPFDHGSKIYTDVMRTQPLKDALTKHGFDGAIGGGRRDEERSRAKERVFSFRDRQHRWDPRNQRPELWHAYNTWKKSDECLRIFPLSNWTELDVWQYILQEQIPIVPLYFAKPRPVVQRDGDLIVVDDDRMPLNEGETPEMKTVRFRTLGCYPVTGAIESEATTVQGIVHEMLTTRVSERNGRAIDRDEAAAMERKKREGYF
ncbi:MAG: sulfate adenylyltransferase subunit CysD [Rubripirellula sp.]